MLNLNVITTS